MSFTFEWDQIKAEENVKKHGVGFEEALTVFGDESSLTIHDVEHSDEETRWVDLGRSAAGRLLVVVYTERGANIRLINCRPATAGEQRQYERSVFQGAREMQSEYDFTDGERGKHAERWKTGFRVLIHRLDGSMEERDFALPEGAVIVDPDLREAFPDSAAVNRALRGLLED